MIEDCARLVPVLAMTARHGAMAPHGVGDGRSMRRHPPHPSSVSLLSLSLPLSRCLESRSLSPQSPNLSLTPPPHPLSLVRSLLSCISNFVQQAERAGAGAARRAALHALRHRRACRAARAGNGWSPIRVIRVCVGGGMALQGGGRAGGGDWAQGFPSPARGAAARTSPVMHVPRHARAPLGPARVDPGPVEVARP